jgi:glyoxylase-like metal-dependent hydrolase (beta-lactamase superfamily II)
MIQGIPEAVVGRFYSTDNGGKTRIAMNGLIADSGDRIVCFDPGCATFLSRSLAEEYDLVMEQSLEEAIKDAGYAMHEVTDVVLTHLHFDHGSGAFLRVQGGIVKAFPNARYVVSKSQLDHIGSLDREAQGSFFHKLLRFAGELTWAEDWEMEGIRFLVSHGHTKHMLVPVLDAGDRDVLYATDLVPMKLHMQPGATSYYDEDKPLLVKEREEILNRVGPGAEIIFYHEPM